MLSDVLKPKHIYEFFSRSAVEKGHVYKAQGRVSELEISEDLTHIRAKVRGSSASKYRVDIQLDFGHDRLDALDGECSCPMTFNCKHVVATLLEALSGKPQPPNTARAGKQGEPAPRAPPPLPYEINEWLEKFGTALRGDDYPAELNQRLLYCLGPSHDGAQTPVLAISLRSLRVLKGGDFATNYAQPSVHDFVAERAPKYYRDADIDILTQLSRRSSRYSYREQPQSVELLQRIVATGRAFWLDHKRPPLRWGEPREGRVEWRQADKRGVAPQLIVPGTIALNAEPPVYVDEAGGTIGPVELNLPPRLACQLLSAPAIPRAQVAEVSRRLGQALPERHHGLLPGAPAPAVEIDEDPVLILRLQRGHVNASGYYYGYKQEIDRKIAVAHLSFRYGPIEIEASERASRMEAFHAGQVYSITRRPGKERAARKRLSDFSFVEARAAFPSLDHRHARDLTLKEPDDWLDFLNLHAAGLQAEGFEIVVDDNFPYRLAMSSGDFDAEFESSGIDWFELALGVEIDGERRDLAPLLAALVSTPDFAPDLIRQLAEAGDHFYLPLADGRHLSLAADRFLPLVLALHGLRLSGVFADASGKIRLSRAEVVPLLALENEKFVFRGADNLRRLADLFRARGLSNLPLPEGFRAELRPYQAQGVAWLDLLRESGLGGVLADDMGLGKTVQILALLALEKARGNLAQPALIVAPTSLMTNWFSEARRFAPDLRVLILHGSGRKQNFAAIPEHDVVLTTYPLIARDREVLLSRDWHMAVLDEAQTVKNPNAATTRWLRDVKARHRFCLTGTPMENHLGELWSIMSFANPGYLGDKAAFSRLWRLPIEKRADKQRATALARRVKPFLLRRTKTEVATELPAKSEIVERIALEGSQRDLYDSIRLSMSDKVRKAIAQRGLARSHIIVLEALLRMRQACCDPLLLKLDDGVQRPSAKLDRLMEMVLELLSEGRKIIVFSQFTSMLDLIRKRFDAERIRYSVLTGETRDRKNAIDGFQNGASDVFLVSLKAGGVGLNLTAADTVIIFDPWWNPAVEEQAIDRAHRIGQDKAVFVYRLVASGTIEEKMDELKARKRALADSLFDRDGRIASALTEEDVQALFDA
ncbi:DEAD/DEAH box helicase [Bradyrhizobium sp. AUGA SZCCT0283]|uniref:DEAD/DEAH box helicase n=1 Tax=Bradyrhizobium sp. AUGA SZCCT0283 TaxID=2807671 RepID=UPI001BAB7E2D|nr:DEAD/DEAH box helicase [Bradyrhizobium sp. AUGA SZCCT0283]MBR1278183.1 DEAD/DEAH box helicase [Bradyrhizobium sp. AUGA SZCCT0283]